MEFYPSVAKVAAEMPLGTHFRAGEHGAIQQTHDLPNITR